MSSHNCGSIMKPHQSHQHDPTSNSQGQGYFEVNDTTGIIRTSQQIDREQLCPFQIKCEVHLNVLIYPLIYFTKLKIVVAILDVNDQSPVFPQSETVLQISESARVGSLFELPVAEDKDGGAFGVQDYIMSTQDPELFGLVVNSDPNSGLTSAQLRLLTPLDRESKDLYSFKLSAFDGGTPPREGSVRVRINVTDANDHSPRFQNSTYRYNLTEDLPPHFYLLTVKATDLDIGENSRISYSFVKQTSSWYDQSFRIDSDTGEIFTTSPLPYESAGGVFNLGVMAVDGGLNPVPAYTRVVFRYVVAENRPPAMTISSLGGKDELEVEENSALGTVLGLVHVTDPDSGSNGDVRCVLKSTLFNLINHYQNEYTLVTASVFDREQRDRYTVDLTCWDDGSPSLVATTSISIQILDVNDNFPLVDPVFDVAVHENNDPEEVLLRITATDRDSANNSRLHFSISNEDTSTHSALPVRIDETTGEVRARISFDYEKKQQHRIKILVRDGGSEPKSATSLLIVDVIDVNDEAPRFSKSIYYFSVDENGPPGEIVGRVDAFDADLEDEFAKVAYTFGGSAKVSAHFTLDETTGEIRTRKHLDREIHPEFRLTVRASNLLPPFHETSVEVVVYVNDANDNKPLIMFPKDGALIESVCDLKPGYPVVRIEAADIDEETHGSAGLLFSLVRDPAGETGPSVFEINPRTGVISLSPGAFHSGLAECKTYPLQVQVADHGIPSQSSTVEFFVQLNGSAPADIMTSLNLNQQQEPRMSPHIYYVISGIATAGSVIIFALIIGTIIYFRFCRKKEDKSEMRLETEADDGVYCKRMDHRASGSTIVNISGADDKLYHTTDSGRSSSRTWHGSSCGKCSCDGSRGKLMMESDMYFPYLLSHQVRTQH